MPMATKMPTQRSSVALLISRYPPEHEDSENEVERENRERAFHDGARCRTRHALCRRARIIALEHGDQADRGAEDEALDHTVDDVVAEIDGGVHVAPEGAGVDADQLHADNVGAENAERREQRGEKRHRHDTAPETRGHDAS